MQQSNRGSVSLIFMVVVIPFFFLLLVVGVELSQFFGLREEVQRIIDNEARLSLGRNYSGAAVSERVRARMSDIERYVTVEDVSVQHSSSSSELAVRGVYQGILGEVAGGLTGGELKGIPFELSSIVRKARSTALVVVDRTILNAGEECTDTTLLARTGFVSKLVKGLSDAGVAQVQVGVMPGERDVVEILSSDESLDGVPRCSGGAESSPFLVSSVAGVSSSLLTDPVSTAYRALQFLLLAASATPVEQQALIMVAPGDLMHTESISTTFALLEAEAGRQGHKLMGIGVAVGAETEIDPFQVRPGGESGRVRYLSVTEDHLVHGELTGALINHVQGRTVIAR